jgi:hypothetical protein
MTIKILSCRSRYLTIPFKFPITRYQKEFFMRYHLTAAFVWSLVFSYSSFALPLNSKIKQSVEVYNKSSQTILVADSTSPILHDIFLLRTDGDRNGEYTSTDNFIVLPEQRFSNTITILSGEGNKPICTVTTHLTVGLTSFNAEEPTISNPSKCEAMTKSSSTLAPNDFSGVEYKYTITVK